MEKLKEDQTQEKLVKAVKTETVVKTDTDAKTKTTVNTNTKFEDLTQDDTAEEGVSSPPEERGNEN